MFKVTEIAGGGSRTFKTWAGCLEHIRLLASQGRNFKIYEKINGKWILAN